MGFSMADRETASKWSIIIYNADSKLLLVYGI